MQAEQFGQEKKEVPIKIEEIHNLRQSLPSSPCYLHSFVYSIHAFLAYLSIYYLTTQVFIKIS